MSGSTLRMLRSLSGLTIYEFASRCGLSKTQLQRYEKGVTPIPSAVAVRIEATFGLDDFDAWQTVCNAAVAWDEAEDVIKRAMTEGGREYARRSAR